MATIHFMQQGKGGSGKTTTCAILAQYFEAKGLQIFCFDTDPVNATLAGYKDLNVTSIDIMNGEDIDPRRFDILIESILALTQDDHHDTHLIVDSGASSFVPFCSYLLENKTVELLEDNGHTVLLHTVITGGQAMLDTLSGLKSLALHFPSTSIVVWLNRYFGEISQNGKSFEEFKVYSEVLDKIHSVINIPHRKHATFGVDIENIYSKRQTFESALNSDSSIIVKQRVKIFWREVISEIDKARLC